MPNQEFTIKEIDFLKESLRWSEDSFRDRATKYFAGGETPVEGYYENIYQPKIKAFGAMQSKLSDYKKQLKG